VSDQAADGTDTADSGAAGRPQRLAWLCIGMGVVSRALRSRPFHERVIIGAIAVAALSGLGQETRSRSFARLVDYAKKLDERAGHAVKKLDEKAEHAIKPGAG
jgi:hypothetical protein